MNIYQKLSTVRVALQDLNLKKTGKVDFTNKAGKRTQYSYYELADILPAINALCHKNDITTRMTIVGVKENEKAILDVVDGSDRISFSIPTAESTSLNDQLKDLGAKLTYLRRYLFMMAFEIVESDIVEAINKELNNEVSEKDKEKILACSDMATLTATCAEMKPKYKTSLITPIYDEVRAKLEQKESKA